MKSAALRQDSTRALPASRPLILRAGANLLPPPALPLARTLCLSTPIPPTHFSLQSKCIEAGTADVRSRHITPRHELLLWVMHGSYVCHLRIHIYEVTCMHVHTYVYSRSSASRRPGGAGGGHLLSQKCEAVPRRARI